MKTEPPDEMTDVACPMCGGATRVVYAKPKEGAVLRCDSCGYARALTDVPPSRSSSES